MTVGELYSIFNSNGFPFRFDIYNQIDKRCNGTPMIFADAKVIAVKNYAIECQRYNDINKEMLYLPITHSVLVLDIVIEV